MGIWGYKYIYIYVYVYIYIFLDIIGILWNISQNILINNIYPLVN